MKPLFSLVASILFAIPGWGAPGDWPEPRQNAHLTAVQPLAGAMRETPVLAGRHDLGRVQPSVRQAVLQDGTVLGLCVVAGTLRCYSQSGTLRWESHPAGLNFSEITAVEDLDGDGSVEALLKAGRPAEPYAAAALVSVDDGALLWRYDVDPISYAWYLYTGTYLPGGRGKQVAVIMHGYPPDARNGYIALFEFGEGGRAPIQRWRYDFDKYTCFPSFLQSDLDGDGIEELVVETHSRMWFLDAPTGQVKHFSEWDVSPANVRSYGLVTFLDLDKDGREDFLCIANFAQHLEVLLNRGGRMEKAWGYGWPESVTTGKVATTWPEPPVADVDGDGKLEVLVSMFNSEHEQAWLLRVYDAVTGEMKQRVPGVIAVATGDADNNGAAEVLVNVSSDPTQAKTEGVRLVSFTGGAQAVVWQDASMTAVKPSKSGELRVNRGEDKFTLAKAGDSSYDVHPWVKPTKTQADFGSVPASVGPPYPKIVVADLLGKGNNQVVLYQDPKVSILEWQADEFRIHSGYSSSSVPVLADLDGDGATEILNTETSALTQLKILVKTPSKRDETVFETQLPPPDRNGLPHARAAYVRTGRFTGSTSLDLYMWFGTPMGRSLVIDGRSRNVVWEKGEVPNSERYWGATLNLAAAYDFDSDGADDVVFTNPDYYCIASGRTGEFLLGPAFPPDIFKQSSQGLYTLPAILERSEATPLVCLVGGHYFQAAMTIKAEPLWYKVPQPGEARSAEEGFFRLPSGDWLLGFGRQNGNFACINVNDGTVRWELPVEATCSDVASCDVDGDGQFEFLFGTSHGQVYAVGDASGSPRVVWKLDAGATAGGPIPADVDGDGKSDLIVPTADGFVSLYIARGSATKS